MSNNRSVSDYSNESQALVLLWVFICSLVCMVLYGYINYLQINYGVIPFLSLSLVSVVLSTIYLVKKYRNTVSFSLLDASRRNKPIIVVLSIIIFLACASYGVIPMYDSAEYFSQMVIALDKTALNPQYFLDNFSIIGKQMQCFSIIAIPFLVIFNCNPIGVYILNTILVLIAVVSVDYIIKHIFGGINSIESSLIGFIYGMFPFIYTGIIYINPDFYCAVFWPILIATYLRKFNVLFIFFSIMFCGMKTNMIITYFIFFIIIEYEYFISNAEIIKKRIGRCIFLISPIIINVYLKYGRNVGTWGQQSTRNAYPLLEVTKARVYQEFFTCFKWLIVILVIYTIIRNRRQLSYDKLLVAIPVSSIVQLFVYIYLNYTKLSICPRYWAIDALMYVVGIGYVVGSIKSQRKKTAFLIIFACIYTSQQFVNIDPVMILMSKRIDFWKKDTYIAVPNNYIETIGIGDSSAFNMQYSVWNSIWKDFLADGVLSQDTVIYSTIDESHNDIAESIRYGVNGLEFIDWYVDISTGKIVYRSSPNTVKMSIENIKDENDISNIIGQDKEEIVLFEPDTVSFEPTESIQQLGYILVNEKYYENNYTSLIVKIFRKE